MKKLFRFLTSAAAVTVTAVLCTCIAFAACDAHQMDSGVITEEPTCERIGIITYTCQNEGCGYSYVEKMGNLGHCFDAGCCITCGAIDELYIPTADEEISVATEIRETAEQQTSVSASAAAQAEWEPPFLNPTVAAPETVALAAPAAPLTVTAPDAPADSSVWFLAGGMALILAAAAAVFTLIGKPELLRQAR